MATTAPNVEYQDAGKPVGSGIYLTDPSSGTPVGSSANPLAVNATVSLTATSVAIEDGTMPSQKLAVDASGRLTLVPNSSVNVAQFGGFNVATGTGASGSGIPRVTVSSDSAPVAQAGEVALYGSNPTALTANTDAAIKWGASGTTAVNHILIANNTTINVNYRLDAATTAGSDLLAPGQKIVLDIAGTLAVHLQANGTPNIGGSTGGNIVVIGWA